MLRASELAEDAHVNGEDRRALVVLGSAHLHRPEDSSGGERTWGLGCDAVTAHRGWSSCLVLAMFLISCSGSSDFGMGLRAYISVTQATREGTRFGAVGHPAGEFTAGGASQCDGSYRTTVVSAGAVGDSLTLSSTTDMRPE
jgi:hypothetical protein